MGATESDTPWEVGLKAIKVQKGGKSVLKIKKSRIQIFNLLIIGGRSQDFQVFPKKMKTLNASVEHKIS